MRKSNHQDMVKMLKINHKLYTVGQQSVMGQDVNSDAAMGSKERGWVSGGPKWSWGRWYWCSQGPNPSSLENSVILALLCHSYPSSTGSQQQASSSRVYFPGFSVLSKAHSRRKLWRHSSSSQSGVPECVTRSDLIFGFIFSSALQRS